MVLSSARQTPEAPRLMDQAIARDPRYGPGLAEAACCCLRLLFDDWSEDREAGRLKGVHLVRRALEVVRDDPGIRAGLVGRVYWRDGGVGRSCPRVKLQFCAPLVLQRHYREHGGPARHRNRGSPAPRSSRLHRLHTRFAHFLSRRFGEAVPNLLLAFVDDPSNPNPQRYLAACYAHMADPTMHARSSSSSGRSPLLLSGLSLAVGETG
jgi:hypothetical protein